MQRQACRCVGRWRWAEKGMHIIREDPVIPVDGPIDAKRKQESGKPVPSLALLSVPFQPPVVGFFLHPKGNMNLYPPQFYRPGLSLRNEIRPENCSAKHNANVTHYYCQHCCGYYYSFWGLNANGEKSLQLYDLRSAKLRLASSFPVAEM